MTSFPDKQLVGSRFGRSLHTYRQSAVVQREMAARLAGMVGRAGAPPHFGRVLEVGAGSAVLTSELLSRHSVGSYFANDLVPASRGFVMEALAAGEVAEGQFLEGDIETLDPLPGGLDLVASNATVQWLHDLGGFFGRMAGALEPGGLLAFSTFGPGNMREIAELEGVSLAYRTPAEIEACAGGLFEPLLVEEAVRRLEFPSPEAVLRHIRETGVNGISGRGWGMARHREFLRRYREAFPLGEGVGLTYHPLYCCFRRR